LQTARGVAGTLPIIRSDRENTWLVDSARNARLPTTTYFSLFLNSRRENTNDFRWNTSINAYFWLNAAVTEQYTNWFSGQPNNAGGTEGGMTNGQPVVVRAAMKPISTIPRALQTVDVATGEPAKAINQRSDVCAVPAAGVVAEAMVSLVMADAMIEKFGGDSVDETRRNLRSYIEHLAFS
jgi:hypothetical protein